MFPGLYGVTAALGVFFTFFMIAWLRLGDFSYQFSAEFDKVLQMYLDITKFILSMAGGGIVLVVSATIFRSSEPIRPLPPQYASPLGILVVTILYGVLFMVFEVRDYEKSKRSKYLYTRWQYAKNQALGFSAITCFCLGYGWLVIAALRG